MPSLIDEQTQFVDSAGAPIVNGSVYIGTRNQNPVTNAITIYSDRGLTTAISNPQTTDANGRTTNKIWVPGRYSIRVDNSAGVQQYQELDAGEEENAGNTKLTNVQGTNTITAEGTPTAVISLTDAQTYIFRAANAPTGACTLQIDLTAAKSIKKKNNTDIQANDWAAGQYVTVVYDATDDVFEMTTAPGIDTVSSITVSSSINLTGGQIAFPATQSASADANTLDDYEEGTWTPVLSDGTNNATTTVANGAYTKIGNVVFINGDFTLSSLGSVSGSLRITGLPFPCSATYSGGFSFYGTNLSITAGQSVVGFPDKSNTFMRLYLWDATTGATFMQDTEITAPNGQLLFGGFYFA